MKNIIATILVMLAASFSWADSREFWCAQASPGMESGNRSFFTITYETETGVGLYEETLKGNVKATIVFDSSEIGNLTVLDLVGKRLPLRLLKNGNPKELWQTFLVDGGKVLKSISIKFYFERELSYNQEYYSKNIFLPGKVGLDTIGFSVNTPRLYCYQKKGWGDLIPGYGDHFNGEEVKKPTGDALF